MTSPPNNQEPTGARLYGYGLVRSAKYIWRGMPLGATEFLAIGWEKFLVLAAAIVLVGNMAKTVGAWLNPIKKLVEDVEEHEEKLKRDDKRITQQDSDMQMMLKCMFVLMNHDIDGNGVDKLKSTRDELQEYITNR